MELDYRTVFAIKDQFGRSPLHETSTARYEWLRRKGLDADRLDLGLTELNEHTVGTLARLEQRDGSIIERFRLTEVRPGQGPAGTSTWMTEVLTVQHPDRHTADVLIHVADPRDNTPGNRPGPTGVPRIVRLFLEATRATDGTMALHDGPMILGVDDEDLVHDMIVDESRRNLLVLAPAAAGASIDDWVRQVTELTFGMAGQAGVFVLTADLARALDGHLGFLPLPAGGMRAFPPGLDPAARISSDSSYYITAARLAERDTKRVGRHWTWLAREHANTQPWPRALQRAMRSITEHERDTLLADLEEFIAARSQRTSTSAASAPVEVAVETKATATVTGPESSTTTTDDQTPTVAPAIEEVDPERKLREALAAALPTEDLLTAVLQIGGCATVTESLQFVLLLAGDYDQLQSKVSALADELAPRPDTGDSERVLELQERLVILQAEIDDLESRLDRETGAARYLRAELITAGRAELAYAAPVDVELAQDFDQVLAVARSLEYVAFTGDASVTADLDEMRGARSAAKKAHRALLALNDYARAKADGLFTGGSFLDYVNDPPAGYASLARGSIVPGESETVMNNRQLRARRELPMPDGRMVFMGAHIRLSQEATTAPRLHFCDDTARSGQVVVGYIGAHLPNTLTN